AGAGFAAPSRKIEMRAAPGLKRFVAPFDRHDDLALLVTFAAAHAALEAEDVLVTGQSSSHEHLRCQQHGVSAHALDLDEIAGNEIVQPRGVERSHKDAPACLLVTFLICSHSQTQEDWRGPRPPVSNLVRENTTG